MNATIFFWMVRRICIAQAQLQRLGSIINGVFLPILETDNNSSSACSTQRDITKLLLKVVEILFGNVPVFLLKS